jgi:hypothetical protein
MLYAAQMADDRHRLLLRDDDRRHRRRTDQERHQLAASHLLFSAVSPVWSEHNSVNLTARGRDPVPQPI